MKKLVAIFFLTIYTATAFGVVVKFHYCDRVLTNISVSNLNGKCECGGHSFTVKDCCTEKTICLQLNTRRITQPPVVLTPKFQQLEWVPVSNVVFIMSKGSGLEPVNSFNRHQRTLHRAIYLLNRVFRI